MIYANLHMEGHSQNSMFSSVGGIHGQSPAYIPRLLREQFLEKGIELNTPDINEGRPVAFDLYFEGRELISNIVPKYLVALENPNINHWNENREYCVKYNKVFAWDKRLYDMPNVVQIRYPHHIVCESFPNFAQRDRFCCLINANKLFRNPPPNDLYQERLNTIRWYESHAPEYFDLYGMGWHKPAPAYTPIGKINRSVASLRAKLFGYLPFPSYRGTVVDKRDVMRRSKFSFCYENTKGPDNYITEKIFDSMMSGCVPVYWGPDNVLDHIPADCFIDRNAFRDTAAVHAHLLSLTQDQYEKYQQNIANYVAGEGLKSFGAEHFVITVVESITSDLQQGLA
ncbi:MAG: glycosyltransferase family 10 [Sideroxydans sp.]|nr:glycosyltransferase family 10 [Sideroxydans sp.]